MGSTNYDWAALVMSRCKRLSVPLTPNNGDNFTRWMRCENPDTDWWHLLNPLNCGLDDGSASGTGSYASLDIAATMTAQVLDQLNMAPILNALAADASLAVFSAGCAWASWSTGGYHDVPGYVASVPQEPVIACPYTFPSVGETPAPPTPAVPPTPLPPNATSLTQEDIIIMGLPSGCTDQGAFNAQVKEWWINYRTDECTVEALDDLWYAWNLPVASKGFGLDPFLLFSSIIDGVPGDPAPLRAWCAGAL